MAVKKKKSTSSKTANGSILPFPPTPSASKAGYTLGYAISLAICDQATV